jgi:TRAP-type C4-dicarboxylate transport system permease small subunit
MTIYAGMVVVTSVEVFARYVLNSAIFWSEEFSRYAFIWVVFLGAPLGILNNIHVGMDIFLRLASPRVQGIMSIISHAGMFVFSFFLFKLGLEATHLGRFQLTPALQISKSWIYAGIPIGGSLMMLATIRSLITDIKKRKTGGT